MPHIDHYEASVLTLPRDVRAGDMVVSGPATAHLVVRVDAAEGSDYATLHLRDSRGRAYQAHRRSAVHVLKP